MELIGINGAGGRMGKLIALSILQQDDMAVTEAFEYIESPCLNADLGIVMGIDEWKIPIRTINNRSKYKMNTIIDFSSPKGFRKILKYAYTNKIKFISGTTGLKPKDMTLMKEYSQSIPIIYSTNMSTGINTILNILGSIKNILNDSGRDIEIIEYHHKLKKDAPSGTAITLANKISGISKRHIKKSGIAEFPRDNSVRIHAIRAGNYSGIHNIIISNDCETIELKHTAHSRQAFSDGVIKAIRFIKNKKKGLFEMTDVLKGEL